LELQAAPWGGFAGLPGIPLSELDGRELSWLLIPRLHGSLAPRTSALVWNGRSLVRAGWGRGHFPESWDLPLSEHGAEQTFAGPDGLRGVFRLVRLGPRARDEDREEDPRERWLHWQYERYKKLARPEPERFHDLLECAISAGARRSWAAVRAAWAQSGEGEAELSLIVELAARTRLIRALESIARSPRRMLRRAHSMQPLSRVREMDPAALRELSRRPGRTVAERAGPRQEILATVREETTDVPENRIFLWTVRRMERMGIFWCKRNERHQHSSRYQSVRRFLFLLRRIQNQEQLLGVSPLQHHMTVPSYCFQFESRYREIWRAYGELRREEHALDDLWRWQGHLWSGTARLVLDSLLAELPGWNELRMSTPYFRSEGLRGEWVVGPSTPGPWKTPRGLCDVFDLREETSVEILCRDLRLPAEIAASGADRVLVLHEPGVVLLTWSCLPAVREAGLPLPGIEDLDGRLRRLSEEASWDARALVLVAEPEATGTDVDWIEEWGRVHVLRFPRDVHRHWGDLAAGLELSLEDASG